MPSVTRLRLAILTHWEGNQEDLAIRCGINNPRLSFYIKGRGPMLPQHRAIIAHVLRVETHEIDGWIPGDELWEMLAG